MVIICGGADGGSEGRGEEERGVGQDTKEIEAEEWREMRDMRGLKEEKKR